MRVDGEFMDRKGGTSNKSIKKRGNAAIDVRTSRTRGKLRAAFRLLLQRKSCDSVSVAEICEQAGVGRSTFYTLYSSKDDLKREGIANMRKDILDQLRGNSTTRPGHFRFSLPTFEHAKQHADHFRALAGSRGGAIALDAVHKTVEMALRQEISEATLQTDSKSAHNYAVAFATGALWRSLRAGSKAAQSNQPLR